MSDPSFAVGVEVAVDEQLVGVHLLVTRLTTPSVQCWVLSDPRLRTSLSVWAQCSGRGVVGFRKIAALDARKTHLGGGCWLLAAGQIANHVVTLHQQGPVQATWVEHPSEERWRSPRRTASVDPTVASRNVQGRSAEFRGGSAAPV